MREPAISITRDMSPADLLTIMQQGYRVFYHKDSAAWGVQNGYGQTVTELVPQTAAIVLGDLRVARMFRDGALTVWHYLPEVVS